MATKTCSQTAKVGDHMGVEETPELLANQHNTVVVAANKVRLAD